MFNGRTVFITGGATGIGQEIVFRFAAEGARIVSLDWDERANQSTAEDVRARGGFCTALTGDVSSALDVQRAFAAAGAVDILVNNAAFLQGDGFLHEISEETWDKTLAACLKSVFLCTKAALPGMIEKRSGVIINMSSVNALTGIHLAAYTAAKGGMISLTRLLTAQYGRFGIRFNTICPGTILTESSRVYYDAHPGMDRDLKTLYPAGQFGTPGDIASAVLFLASDRAAFINGATISIDGGLSVVHQLPSISQS